MDVLPMWKKLVSHVFCIFRIRYRQTIYCKLLVFLSYVLNSLTGWTKGIVTSIGVVSLLNMVNFKPFTRRLFTQACWLPVGQVYFSLKPCSSSSLSEWVCERLYTLTPTCLPASEPAGRGESKQGRGLRPLFRARGVLRGAQAVCFKRRVSASSQVPSALCARSVSGQLSPRPAFKPLPHHLPLVGEQSNLRKVHSGRELINSQLGSAAAPRAWPTSPPLLTVKDIWMCVGHGSGSRAPAGVRRTVRSVKASQFR